MLIKINEFRLLKVATAIAVCLPFSPLAVANPGVDVLRKITQEDIASLPPMITQREYTERHVSEAPSLLQSFAAMDGIGGPAVVEQRVETAPVQRAQPAPVKTAEVPVYTRSIEAPAPVKTAEAPVYTRSIEAPAPVKTTEAPVFARSIEAPAPVETTEAPVFARSIEAPAPIKPVESQAYTRIIEAPVKPIEAPSYAKNNGIAPPAPAQARSGDVPRLVDRQQLASSLNNQNVSASKSGQAETKAVLKKNYDFFPPVQQDYQPDPAYNNVRWNGEIDGESGKRTPANATPEVLKSQRNSPSRAFLRQMVSLALTHSPEIRSSEADVLAAGYLVDQTKGQRWPQVQLGVATPLGNQGSSDTTRHNAKISDTSGSVSVTTPIFDWGKISNQIDSAEEGVNAAVNSQNYAKEQLAYSTISELMNLSRYQENRVVALAYVGRMKQLADMLEQITAADKGRASEYVQAKAKLLSARASLDDIEHQASTSRIKLVRLLGIEPNLPPNISWQDSVMPSSTALAALSKNPNLLKLQAQVKAAEYEAESVQAANLPQLNWVVSKNTAKDINGDESGWYTGLNVQWNAFSGGSQKAAQMAARVKANGAQQQYEAAYRDLEYQINNMIQTRDSSFMRADDFGRLSTETDRVRKMFYDQWYNLGKRTLLDVLTAENDHFNNQLSAINNRYDAYISNINVIASAAMLLNWVGN
ncbi:TolC family protein [Serratia fonticola]|uniref:TolC family protein n=1 Tax=Serratia fonticola TaxID=47917 RepID=UPI0034C5E103